MPPTDATLHCTEVDCPRFHRAFTYTHGNPEGKQWEAHWHQHFHEVLWGSRGTLAVETPGGVYMVPPGVGLYLPAGIEHAVLAGPRSEFKCSFFHVDLAPALRRTVGAVTVPPVVQELLGYLGSADCELPLRRDTESLACRLLSPVDLLAIGTDLPADDRLRTIARGILDDPADDSTLEAWGLRVGASGRNLSRLFVRETGMTFAQWRLQARLRVAVSLLAGGMGVGSVARHVGYQSASAFVAVFRRETGLTPGALQEEYARRYR